MISLVLLPFSFLIFYTMIRYSRTIEGDDQYELSFSLEAPNYQLLHLSWLKEAINRCSFLQRQQ